MSEKQLTIRNNFSKYTSVFRDGIKYYICSLNKNKTPPHLRNLPLCNIFMQDGLPEKEINGATVENLIMIAIDRIGVLDKEVSCRENKAAIEELKVALSWLNVRTEDRINRGVEGTDQV